MVHDALFVIQFEPEGLVLHVKPLQFAVDVHFCWQLSSEATVETSMLLLPQSPPKFRYNTFLEQNALSLYVWLEVGFVPLFRLHFFSVSEHSYDLHAVSLLHSSAHALQFETSPPPPWPLIILQPAVSPVSWMYPSSQEVLGETAS